MRRANSGNASGNCAGCTVSYASLALLWINERSAPSSFDWPSAIDSDVEHDCRAGTVGQQAGRSFGEHRRIQARLAVGQVQRRATLPRLFVERIAIVDEPGDVGDGVVQQHIVADHLDVERLIEIRRRCRVERHERPVGAIDMLCRLTLRGGVGRIAERQRGNSSGTLNCRRMLRRPSTSSSVRSARIRT